ncbi:MAG: universal stress protein [Solirubrobacteraceae bacterium]|nr:universal stress protein [Solirubrobacteraceae bacterium]
MILLCFDGSADARAAIDQAGELLNGQAATVLTVWEPFIDVVARSGTGLGFGAGSVDFAAIDASNEQAARDRANEGVERARRAGLNAQPRTSSGRGTIAETILLAADEVDANAVVLGSRGLTGVKSLLLGSVSHALLQHADRTVIVVPSPEVAADRAAHRHGHRAADPLVAA